MTAMASTSPAYDVLAMGRISIDLYAHQIGVPITDVTSFDAYVGGCPTNVSVGTRRLGLRSALLTAVGDDQVGEFVTVLNVLGAGDAFASGFHYGYLQGWPLERAARMGNATGAIVVTQHGCANFMPTLDEVAAFVSDRGGQSL
jgi:sugar/nucleoside kinase (ribokinase family)